MAAATGRWSSSASAPPIRTSASSASAFLLLAVRPRPTACTRSPSSSTSQSTPSGRSWTPPWARSRPADARSMLSTTWSPAGAQRHISSGWRRSSAGWGSRLRICTGCSIASSRIRRPISSPPRRTSAGAERCRTRGIRCAGSPRSGCSAGRDDGRYVPPEMIAFGSPITDHALYEACAEPGIKRVAEPDSEILALGSAGLGDASIFRNYNLLIEEATKLENLEALVLVHQDAEIVDDEFCEKVRRALRDPDLGILGCAGAVGVRNIAWWDGSVTLASFSHRYTEYGGGEILGSTFNWEEAPPEARTGEVDVIDGFMMVLPPWFIENIRFDETLGQLHGYDFDVCQQVRAAGKKVMTEHIRVIHHHSLELIGDVDGWIAAHMRVAEKWDGKLSPAQTIPGEWRDRARWAEARRDAALMQANAAELARDAAVSDLERQLRNIEQSASWRLTKPLRWLKALLRRGEEPSRNGNSPGPLPSRQR